MNVLCQSIEEYEVYNFIISGSCAKNVMTLWFILKWKITRFSIFKAGEGYFVGVI